jgi:recombination protein RecT
MPEIAAMLPEGMSADRFRRVVVQALVRNPELWECTPVSVVSAIVEAAQLGLEPTGVLGRAWMLPYSRKVDDVWIKEAKLIVGYRGYAELTWRADQIIVTTGAVRDGDEFAYQRGTDAFLRHVPASDDPDLEANDANITHFWAMYTLPDGRREFEVMSRKAAERIRDKARFRNPVWESDFGEMGRKTVLRRLLKVAPLSPEVQRVLGRDEEIDFDTPIARVADEKATAARERITERTTALRSGRDPWMARLHAAGAERGLDHGKLHDYAKRRFGVESITELDPSQRADLMEAVERQPVIETPGSSVPTDSPATEAPASGGTQTSEIPTDGGLDADVVVPEGVPPSSSGAPTLEDVLAVSGGELVPDKPDYVKRAEARAAAAKPKNARAPHEATEVTAGL